MSSIKRASSTDYSLVYSIPPAENNTQEWLVKASINTTLWLVNILFPNIIDIYDVKSVRCVLPDASQHPPYLAHAILNGLNMEDIGKHPEEHTLRSLHYDCHQLLRMVYGLNKSYTKKITIGLENKKIGGEFIPVIRLSADDFIGIPLTASDWHLFEENFPVIEQFFETEEDNMLDKKIPFSHFGIRLIMSLFGRRFTDVK